MAERESLEDARDWLAEVEGCNTTPMVERAQKIIASLADALEEERARWQALGHSTTQWYLPCQFTSRRREGGGEAAFCLTHRMFHD